MNCPKCFEPLRIADRQGIEIDYCPECRGVWLDKGELDKIIERTMQSDFNRPSSNDYREEHGSRENRHHKESRAHHGDHYKKHKHSKKKHILKEIFDLFD